MDSATTTAPPTDANIINSVGGKTVPDSVVGLVVVGPSKVIPSKPALSNSSFPSYVYRQ